MLFVCLCACTRPRPRTYFLADSDEESSSAGSSDEEDTAEVPEIPGVEGWDWETFHLLLCSVFTSVALRQNLSVGQKWAKCLRVFQLVTMKIAKEAGMALKHQPTYQRWPHTCKTYCMNNSFLHSYVGGHRPSKIMRFVDKIAKSKYFQKATETEFIKKKMEEVSNTPLVLTVEVQECQGTLAVNIPPPPTDRIWYRTFFNILFKWQLHGIMVR